jgi:DNA-binding winged helix-turn-helix (wHTH) protein
VNRTYWFDDFFLDADLPALYRRDTKLDVLPQAVELLALLVERAGEVVSKDELLASVWPDGTGTLNNLAQHVFLIRKALGDSLQHRRYVVTVRDIGYRFVAEVHRDKREQSASLLAHVYYDAAADLERHATPDALRTALHLYGEAIGAHPEFYEAYAARARCACALADNAPGEAQQLFEDALADAHRVPQRHACVSDALVVRAEIALRLRYAWAEAREHAEQAARLHPEHIFARITLARLHAARGEFSMALAFCEGDTRDLLLCRAYVQHLAGVRSQAHQVLSELLAANPRDVRARLLIAEVLLANGEPREALLHLEHLVHEIPAPLWQTPPIVTQRALGLHALACAAMHDADGIRQAWEAFNSTVPHDQAMLACVALVSLARRRLDDTMRQLHIAIGRGEFFAPQIAADPLLSSLHARGDWRRVRAALKF